jgi:hypothetical protein
MHLAAPASTDYWVNDQRGDPLFVVTADANAAMTKMLVAILTDVRQLLGPRRHSTIVFDRGGWSPKLFRNLLDMGFDILTYRKGRSRRIAATRFSPHQAKLDGRAVRYLLQDQPVRFLKGKLRLRQVTRLTDDGHQTPIVTSRWDLRAIVIAYRMFERWRQENFFKYLRQEYLIDALVDYCNARWYLAVNEHGYGEVAIRKHRDDMGQMRSNCLNVLGILTIVDCDFNGSPIRQDAKVMCRTIVRKPHCLITVLFHIGLMLFVHGAGLRVLSYDHSAE